MSTDGQVAIQHRKAESQGYLLAVLMPWCVHVAVVMEKPKLLTKQAMHNMGTGILPLQQASEGAAQSTTQVHRPIVSVKNYLKRKRGQVNPDLYC